MQTPDSIKANEEQSGPATPLELVRLGLEARQRGDLAASLEWLEAASKAAPEKLNILVELANTLRAMSRLEDAEAIYARVLEHVPDNFGALVGLGHVAKQRADREAALVHFAAAAKANPHNLNILVEMANTLRELSRREEAEAIYRRVMETEPGNWPAALGLAYIAQEREDWIAALAHFEGAARTNPHNLNIQVEIGNTLREMSRFEEAETIYLRVLEKDPEKLGALVGLAHIARERDQLPVALELFEKAAVANPTNLNIQAELGNILREMSRFEDAEAVYRRILEKEPTNFRVVLGLAYMARERAQWPIALEHFQTAAALQPKEANIQLEIVQTLRAMKRLEEAEATGLQVLERFPKNAGALTVLGLLARQRQDAAAALGYFTAAAARDPSKLEIQVEIGNALRELDRYSEAVGIYRRVIDQKPDQFGALLGMGFVARQRGEWAEALAHFEAAAASRPEEVSIHSEVARALCDLHRYDDAEAAYFRVLDQTPYHDIALLGLGIVARQRGDWLAALAYFKGAAAVNSENLKAQLEIAGCLRELLRPDEAEAHLRSLEENPAFRDDPELQAKKLEHFCTTLQLERAAEVLASWGGHRKVPTSAIAIAASLYAARGQWPEVLDLFRERVVESEGAPRMTDLLLEAVARGTRATGRYGETLALLDRLPEAKVSPGVINLREQIAEELNLLNCIDSTTGKNIARQELKIETPLRAWRAGLVAQLLGSAKQTKPNRTIYLCTDRNYLPGAAVAVCSLLRNNMSSLRNYSLVVFCSDEILDFATETLSQVAAAFSVPIQMRASTSLFAAGSGLRTGWGIFTPGHALSEAAYYRIYAALKLLEEGFLGRALYVDSDICVGPNLDQLLEFDLGGQPLGARPEIPSLVEIRRAAQKLGITYGTYFNSGVLLLDLSHPKMADALRRAIDISLTQKHLLTFVDQCALNLAFQGMYAALPEPFNMYVREETKSDALIPNPVVRHFLQRPKPWDPMYGTANSRPWFEEFAALAQIVDTDKLKRLLALQFPERPTDSGQGSVG